MDEPEPGWRPGDALYIDLSDGQTVRCRIVDVLEDCTDQLVPERPATIT
jgi:hypothetical protein